MVPEKSGLKMVTHGNDVSTAKLVLTVRVNT